MGHRIISLVAAAICWINVSAQLYYGMGGLINVPSADMDTILVARLGVHYVNEHMIPDKMKIDGEKYNSWTNYLSVQPFRWIEVGYGYTLQKFHWNEIPTERVGFYSKDRYFSLRLQPVRETKWCPSVLIGGQDVWGSYDRGHSESFFYRNFYLAVSKHKELYDQYVGVHLAYRHFKQDYNKKWNGLIGGLTIQPSFYRSLRFIGEYDGQYVNVGADCTLWRYFMFQASLQKFRYFSGGVCLRVPLVRMNK